MQRVPPFIFYLFYVTYKIGRDQKVPLSIFFGTKIFKVSKESPLRVFWYFATECMLMNPKGSPLFIFRHYATFSKFFFKKITFSKSFSNFVPSRETVIFQSYRAWKAPFGCLESVFKAFHEYVLSIFRKLCASWALDIAPTLDVPVLMGISVTFDHFFSSSTHVSCFQLIQSKAVGSSNWYLLVVQSKSCYNV